MFRSLSSSGAAAMAKLTGAVPTGGDNSNSSISHMDDTEQSGSRRKRSFAPLPVKGNAGRRGNRDPGEHPSPTSTNGSSSTNNGSHSEDDSDGDSDGDSYYSGNSSSSQSEEDMEPFTNHTSNVTSQTATVEELRDLLRHKDQQINRLQRALDHHHKHNLTNGDHRHRTIQTTPYNMDTNDDNDLDDSALSRDDNSLGTVGTMGTVHTHVEEIAEKLGEGLGNAGDAIGSALSNFKHSMSSGTLANVAGDVLTRGVTRSLSGDGGPVPLSSMRRSAGGSAANLLDQIVPGRIARSRSSGTISKIMAEQRSRNTGTINVAMMQQRNANSLTANGSVTSGSTGNSSSFLSRTGVGRNAARKSAWQEVRDLTATVEDLQQQVKGKDTALGTLVRVKKILDEKIETQEAQIAALQQAQMQQQAQLLETEQEKLQLLEKEKQQQNQLKQPEKGKPQTPGPSQQELEDLEQKLRKQSEQLERIKLERDALMQDNEQLTAQKEELEQENQEMLQDAEETISRTDSMTRQHQQLSQNLGNSLQQKDQMGLSLQQMAEEKEQLAQEKEELRSQLKREASAVKTAQEEVTQHANAAKKAQEAAAVAAQQLHELQVQQQHHSTVSTRRSAPADISGNHSGKGEHGSEDSRGILQNQIAAVKATLGKLISKHQSLHQNLESVRQCLCETRDKKVQT